MLIDDAPTPDRRWGAFSCTHFHIADKAHVDGCSGIVNRTMLGENGHPQQSYTLFPWTYIGGLHGTYHSFSPCPTWCPIYFPERPDARWRRSSEQEYGAACDPMSLNSEEHHRPPSRIFLCKPDRPIAVQAGKTEPIGDTGSIRLEGAKVRFDLAYRAVEEGFLPI